MSESLFRQTLINPLDPSSFNHRNVKLANGRQYHLVDQKPNDYVHGVTPVALLIHGFPEFWYGWRYQIGPWVGRGWRLIVPDMLGYGGTDKPSDLALYAVPSHAADMGQLLDALDVKQPVVVIGHDWGSGIAWMFARRYRERVRALVSISIPYFPSSPVPVSGQMLANMKPDVYGYVAFMSSPDSVAVVQNNISRLIDITYRSFDKALPIWNDNNMEKYFKGELPFGGRSDVLGDKEREYYVKTFENGIEGPMKYYQALPLVFEQGQALNLEPGLPKEMPILLVALEGEQFANADRVKEVEAFVPSQEVVHIRAAHYVMLEKPREVEQIIGNWVEKKLKV